MTNSLKSSNGPKKTSASSVVARNFGSCPELFYGGCHGPDARRVFDELCEIVEETIHIYEQEGKTLPTPMSGRELVNTLQEIA